MQDFNHLEALWASHSVEVNISAEQMLMQVKKDIRQIKIKSILNILGMISSFLIILSVWFIFPFQTWTSYVGVSIILITIGIYVVILYRHYLLISKTDDTLHPLQYIHQLKKYQFIHYKLYHQMYWLYTFALSIGLIFYFIEILRNLHFIQQIGVVSFIVVWIVFCATFLRKKIMNREKEKIESLIQNLERLDKQFTE